MSARSTQTRRAVAWVKNDPFGVEFAEIDIAEEHLTASGVAVGTAPLPYRLDYELETRAGFATARLRVEQPDRWIAGVATRTRNADEMEPERARLPGLWQLAAEDKGELQRAYRTDFEVWRPSPVPPRSSSPSSLEPQA
jgi:hypothetical protein